MTTNQNILELDQLLGRYVGTIPANATPEMFEFARARLAKVSAFTKFAFGLGRNVNIIRPIVETIQKTLKNEKMEEYQKEQAALANEPLDPAGMAARIAELREKHGYDAMVEDNNRRYREVLEMEVPVEFYKIPLNHLPGWNDPDDVSIESRRGVVDPLDLAKLSELGILYDPSEPKPN